MAGNDASRALWEENILKRIFSGYKDYSKIYFFSMENDNNLVVISSCLIIFRSRTIDSD